MMKREVVNDPMVYVSPCASFEDDALAVLLAKVGETNKMHSLVNFQLVCGHYLTHLSSML